MTDSKVGSYAGGHKTRISQTKEYEICFNGNDQTISCTDDVVDLTS